MYLSRKEKCSPRALFDVPHKPEPMTAAQIEKKFPDFAKEMNGSSEDCCLLYFWQRNKETKVYEFIDMEAEEEVAEILGVEVYDEELQARKKERLYMQQVRALTEQEIKDFKEELDLVRRDLQKFIRNTTKASSEEEPGEERERG